MKHALCIIFFFSFGFHTAEGQNWTANEIGQCPTSKSFDITVADGRNDNVNRLYVTTTAGGLYEWSYIQDQWQMTSTVVEDFIALPSISVGDGRNDGINRLYIVEFKNAGARLREFTRNGNSWSSVTILNQIQSLGVKLGDGRNDGVNRIYVTSIDFGLMEFTYQNGTWSQTSVVGGGMEGVPDIGDAKNDGDPSVYAPAVHVWDSDYENGSFENTALDVDKTWPDALQIAPGRNDGVNRVYANCTGTGGAGRKEYTWNGNGWDIEIVEAASQRGDIHVAQLKSDGKYRVYINTSEYFRGPTGPLDEYEWNGSQWVKTETVMPTGSYATAMMASGIGRNDKVVRMYTPKWTTGGIYEITNKDPYVITTVNNQEILLDEGAISISPNPMIGGEIKIDISDDLSEKLTQVDILQLTGQIVLSSEVTSSSMVLSIENLNMSGFYFLHFITNDGEVIVKKLLKI